MRPRLVRAGRRHRLGAALLATALAVGVGVSPAAVRPALAAGPLRVEANTTYELDPEAGRVHVAISFELTNLKPSSATTIFYYSDHFLAVQPEATRLRASDAIGALSTTTKERRFFTRVQVHLRDFLYYNESTRFTVRYDLEAGAPRSDSWIRVSRAFATFGVWAWGDNGLGTVDVRIPDGYETTVDGDRMRTERAGPGETLTAEPAKPDTFYAILSADSQSAYTSTRISLAGDIELVVRAWPEDHRWEETVTATLRTGMPGLVDLIGLDWPVDHDLEVRERFTPALEGYAGVFFTDEERIEMSEDLDPLTTLHEASHAWFNDLLFVDRWIYEGLAEEYSWRVLTDLDEFAGFGPIRPEKDDPGYVPLEHWTYPEAIRDQETDDLERYGYQASFWVVHQIVEAAGVDQMRTAFDAAYSDRTAYVGAPAPETVAAIDDWHRFLDLAQPIEQPDSPEVEAAFKELVRSGGNAPLIDQRHDARVRYRELLAAGQGWMPPWFVRRPMGEWTFYDAGKAMDAATVVLQQRDQVEEAGAALGLTPDDALRTAYETATDGFTEAERVAARLLQALAAIQAARGSVDASTDLVSQIGLLGSTSPAASYDAARAAFERGELDAAIASAGAVSTALAGAATLGQERLTLGVVVALAMVLLVAVLLLLRRRRRRRTAFAPASVVAPAGAMDVSAATPVWPGPAPAGMADGPPAALGWPAVDLAPHATTEQPEPAWWLPTRESPDPAPPDPSGTLATDPASPSPPPAANPPEREGDAAPGEPSER